MTPLPDDSVKDEELRTATRALQECEISFEEFEALVEQRVKEARIQGYQTTSTVLQYVIDADSGFMGDSKAAAKHWKKQTDKLINELNETGGNND